MRKPKRDPQAAALNMLANGLGVLSTELRSVPLSVFPPSTLPYEPIERRAFIMLLLTPGEDEYGDETPPLIDEATAQRLLEMR